MFFTRVTYLKGWGGVSDSWVGLAAEVKNIGILLSYRQKTSLWLCIRISGERGRGIRV